MRHLTRLSRSARTTALGLPALGIVVAVAACQPVQLDAHGGPQPPVPPPVTVTSPVGAPSTVPSPSASPSESPSAGGLTTTAPATPHSDPGRGRVDVNWCDPEWSQLLHVGTCGRPNTCVSDTDAACLRWDDFGGLLAVVAPRPGEVDDPAPRSPDPAPSASR